MLRKSANQLKLFPATEKLESIALDILVPLLRTPKGNLFLLIITDRLKKLTITVPMRKIAAWDLARAFTTHLDFVYGPRTRF